MLFIWTYILFILTVSDAQFLGPQLSNSIKCTGEDINFPWSYDVSSNNASTVRWRKDGSTILTLIFSTGNLVYDVSNGYSASKIVYNGNGDITIKLLDDSDAGEYECSVVYASSGMTITSAGVTLSISCNKPCEGKTKARAVLICLCAGPAIIEMIILIIMYYRYHLYQRFQEVIITAIKDGQLHAATRKINDNAEQTIVSYNKDGKCWYPSIALDGEILVCTFDTGMVVHDLKFMITAELLNVKLDKQATLPTQLTVHPQFATITWYFNGKPLRNNNLRLTIPKVTLCDLGVYSLEMEFESGLTILIQEMLMQAADYQFKIIMVVCPVVNMIFGAIGCGIIELNKTKDGFCVDRNEMIGIALGVTIVLTLLVMALNWYLYILGKGKKPTSRRSSESAVTPKKTENSQPNVVMITTDNVWINTPIGRKMPNLPAIQMTNQSATEMDDKKQKKKKKKSKNQIKDSSRIDIQQSQEDTENNTVQAVAD